MTGSPQQAAKHFQRDAATVRKWIAQGCPVVRPGRRGPGRAAVLDFDAVRKWRRQFCSSREPHAPRSDGDLGRTLARVAEGFAECVRCDRVEERTGATEAEAAALFILAFERIAKAFGKKYAFDELPEPIRALAREL